MSRAEFERTGQRSESPHAKGRVALSRADVVQAGAALLDSEGLEGLSMRKLAAALQTGPATLYWHVRDKDELLALILDDTVRGVTVPASGSWDERIMQMLRDGRTVLLPRPVLVRFIWEGGWSVGAETLRVADGLIGLVAQSGLPEDEVADAYFALITFLFGFILAETSTGHPRFGATNVDDAELYPHLLRYGPATDPEGMDRRFAYGVACLLDGITTRAPRRPIGRR